MSRAAASHVAVETAPPGRLRPATPGYARKPVACGGSRHEQRGRELDGSHFSFGEPCGRKASGRGWRPETSETMAWASRTLAVPRGETDRLILADAVPPRIRVVHDPTTLRPAGTLRRTFTSSEISTNEAATMGCCGLTIPPPRDGHAPRDQPSSAASLSIGSSGGVILRLAGFRRSRMSQPCISGSPLHGILRCSSVSFSWVHGAGRAASTHRRFTPHAALPRSRRRAVAGDCPIHEQPPLCRCPLLPACHAATGHDR